MSFLIALLVAVALSLDAFSLSIIYGTIIQNKKKILILSILVGIFHFFMPLFGHILSNFFISYFISNTNILSFIIFFLLGVEMLISKSSSENISNLSNLPNCLFFAFTVSLDSFSVGVTLVKNNLLLSIITFSITSFVFTYIGLTIGKYLKKIFGDIMNKIGGLILIILSIYYLLI